jgi:uncharacterized protein (TIGR02466 family)
MARAVKPRPSPLLRTQFVTTLYEAQAVEANPPSLNDDLLAACLSIAEDDAAGQAWCEEKGYPGYTSYASLNDLEWRDPALAALGALLDRHVAAFADLVQFDLGGQALKRESLWINVLDPDGFHSGHIHPHSVVSGTYYVAMPEGAAALRFEDPRLGLMMASPPRRDDCDAARAAFVAVTPRPGMVLLWESWLRHEVLINRADDPRVSISFNYRWG